MSYDTDKFTRRVIAQRKSDGSVKEREIHIPSEETLTAHRHMLRRLHNLDIDMPYASGGLPGKHIVEHNVAPHSNNNEFYMIDIKDAFSAVNLDTLRDIVREQLPSTDQTAPFAVEEFIDDWVDMPNINGLPQGAPTSPYLFNLYCNATIDPAIGELADERGHTYTRYLDDLTLSSKRPIGRYDREAVRATLDSAGFELSTHKTKRHTLGPHAVSITGVSIYPGETPRRIQPGPALLDTTRRVFDEADGLLAVGAMLYDNEIGRIHGLHGAVHQLTEGTTPAIPKLERRYKRIVRNLALYGYESHVVGRMP